MKSKRKAIAVITSEIGEQYQSKIVYGVKEKAVELNYNVAVFSSFIKQMTNSPLNEIGEARIFDLINYDKFDGFVFIATSIGISGLLEKITEKLRATGKPVVTIDTDIEGFYSVHCDNFSSIKNLTNHLIKDHGYRRINCLTGYDFLDLSTKRLEGYFAALTENGIPIEKDRYAYGDFWVESAKNFVEHIFNCGLELPQAVVCANDIMAIEVCKSIERHGLKVPDDIAVTGFDRGDDGKVNDPQIASINPPMQDAGRKAVEIIYNVMTGAPVEHTCNLSGEFVPSKSCGCSGHIDEFIEVQKNARSKIADLNTYFFGADMMSEELLTCNDAANLFERTYNHFYLLNNIDVFYAMLIDDWDTMNDDKVNDKEKTDDNVYHETVNCVISYDNYRTEHIKTVKSEDMFPYLWDDDLPAKTYYFLPVCFKDLTFGYAVCSFAGNTGAIDYIFRQWIRCFSNALEHVRSQEHLQWAMSRLERISEMDSLTGVYNRLGYQNRIHNMLQAAKDNNKDFLIIMGDLDCLKTINDQFGHPEGDNAIRIIAKAFQNSFTNDEICARLGGDEFILAGVGEYDEEMIENYKLRIYEYLYHYNENSTKPYIIGVSLGCFCVRPDQNTSIDFCLEQADEIMYADKRNKEKIVIKP